MFSTGQIVFGIIFAIVFFIIIGFMYRKDLKFHQIHYKGSLWVLLAFFAFIGLIVAIKVVFK